MNQEFNIKNWVSDPCFVLPWDGIQCSNNTSAVRVSEMSLHNNHLTGAFPNLSSLTKLETLDLQNNKLSGNVPDWLIGLYNLKELIIENNNFSGVIPRQLLNRRTLEIKYSANHYLCMSKRHCLPSDLKESKVRIILGSTLASGIVIIGLTFIFGIVVWRKSHKRHRKVIRLDYSMISVPNSSKSHAFTPDEMVAATQNFSVKIRQGGFGSVFWGKLAQGDQIAVKVLSLFSKQGVVQFLNEIDLLSKIHHRNLVSLLGYCNACRDLMLVYEYMCEGSLNDHLYGCNAVKYPILD